MKRVLLSISVLAAMALSGCQREERRFKEAPPSGDTAAQHLSMSEIYPGNTSRLQSNVKNIYEENAYTVSEGKRLFGWYNCSGCHANGGGGIGPPLIDQNWIYGSEPQNIHQTIIEGRPNGMPSFRGKIPDYQVWQLVAYVRSLSGQLRPDVASGRPDNMYAKKSEESKEPEHPKHEQGARKPPTEPQR
jgi:cytochrome c oxidase cbb3-type subunit 3